MYRIDIHTGAVGTDATVYVTLYGSEASSNELAFVNDGARFAQNSVDMTWLELSDLGDLSRLRVRHDNAGSRADWFLRHVDVRCADSDQLWHFRCDRWLARHHDDGETERTLDLG
jgi:hypothetical protein